MGVSIGVWDVRSALPQAPLLSVSAFTTLADGLDHPEGVACGPSGEICAGGEAGQLYAISLDGAVRQIASTGGFVLGLCLDAARNISACDNGRHEVVRTGQDGTVATWSNGSPGPQDADAELPDVRAGWKSVRLGLGDVERR